jgi:colicin import membrane protein
MCPFRIKSFAMPNYAQHEQDVLTKDQLALTIKSRQPALAQLDDAAILNLLGNLHAAKNAIVEADASNEPTPATLLRSAIRRVDVERRKRGLSARKTADVPSMPVGPHLVTAKLPAVATSRRKPASSLRVSGGRKSSDARKTDQRTEPHRVVKCAGKTSLPALGGVADNQTDIVTRKSNMSLTEAEKAIKQAARKAEKEATKAAEKEAEREARRAERKALKDAEKAEARLERRAARKAEKDAERLEEKQAEKAERKAGRLAEEAQVAAAEAASAAAEAQAAADAAAAAAPKAQKAKAPKAKGAEQKKPK